MISSGIGIDDFSAFIYYLCSSFFSALEIDFPPFIGLLLFLGSGLDGGGSFLTGAGDGAGGFFSLGLPLLVAGLFTAEVA